MYSFGFPLTLGLQPWTVMICSISKSRWKQKRMQNVYCVALKNEHLLHLKYPFICHEVHKMGETSTLYKKVVRYRFPCWLFASYTTRATLEVYQTGFFQDEKFEWVGPDDEDDTRSSHECLNDLEEEYQAKALLANFKRFFKNGTQRFSSAKATDQTECHKCGKKSHFARDCWSKTSVPLYPSPFQSKLLLSSENKPEPRQTKDFEAKYHKVKAKLAIISLSASTPSSSSCKKKGHIVETYNWDDEEMSSDENEVTEVKALMALTDEERVSVGKESARNGDWTMNSMKKVHTHLEMEDNDDRKSFLDYLCIDLNYVEEQRNNLLSKYKNIVQELNTCKEQLLADARFTSFLFEENVEYMALICSKFCTTNCMTGSADVFSRLRSSV
nr:hypothetical protein [Tanacetum cinerariifolium]